MSSNGLLERAKTGTCRMCGRRRKTDRALKAVGEVCHGYATGHIWECLDEKECDMSARSKLMNPKTPIRIRALIEEGIRKGRFKDYQYFL